MRLVGCILVIMPFFVFGQGWTIAESGDKTLDQYVRDLSEVDGSDDSHSGFFKICGAA